MKKASIKDKKNNPHLIHLGIAEAGKIDALAGRHKRALEHYREAIRLAVSISAPEIFFRHYSQCVLESMELTEDFKEVIEFYQSADEHYTSLSLADPLHARDHASLLERLGIVQLKAGDIEQAKQQLQRAVTLAGKHKLQLAEKCLDWLGRGFSVDKARLLDMQRRYKYFTVRRDQVDKSLATPLPQSRQPNKAGHKIPGFARL